MGEKILGYLMRKVLLKVVIAVLPLLLVILVFIATIIIAQGQSTSNDSSNGSGNANVSASVLAWKSTVDKYAKQFGISQYENLILAVIQQESGGTSVDVMQSAEGAFNTKYPKCPNGITDPDYSIYCGVQELKEALTEAGAKGPDDIQGISLALQTYNFGTGFISFAKSHGGYSLTTASAFSSSMGGYYGDVNYVPHVLKYYSTSSGSSSGSGQLAIVIQTAESEQGKPYVWGASGPDSFDCSGLVYYCYSKAGFKISRETAQDYYDKSTKTTSPNVGDLVFFGTPPTFIT